jgi:hypothetical protein
MSNRKTVAVIAEKTFTGNWRVLEIDDMGNNYTIIDLGKSKPTVSCSGTTAYVAWDGVKNLYDFSGGFGTGNLRSI